MKKYKQPNKLGRFGEFGGMYVAETLMPILIELDESYKKIQKDKNFKRELNDLFKNYVGRPSPLYHAKNLTKYINGPKIYFKRDELNHTGAHKINNCLGQILLAKKMGKTRIIAETGAGQHGCAVAACSAYFSMPCFIFMGSKDIERQKPNVFRMKLLGATIIPVESGSKSLKDAMNEALREWIKRCRDSAYVIGSTAGPHPYPKMVRDFQSVIGKEAREQILKVEKRLPDIVCACIGGGSNSMGLFYPFLNDKKVKLIGVEAAGEGANTKKTAATMTSANSSPGVLHGSYSYVLQNKDGQINEAHSISAGLDYPGVGPEHSYLKETKRVKYFSITDKEALNAFQLCSKLEGIIPALEPSHALAYLIKSFKNKDKNKILILNMCGRGDKDLFTAANALGVDANE